MDGLSEQMPVWRDEAARVMANDREAPGHFRLELECPGIAAAARPGQFAMIEVGEGLEPLLRRPISFFRIIPEMGRVSFLYRVAGKGTSLLSRAVPGTVLRVIGPLGNGFPTDSAAAVHLLVGGGVGTAPLAPLARRLAGASQARGRRVIACVGARTAAELMATDELSDAGAEVRPATEDGSAGVPGLVTDILETALKEFSAASAAVYACGPVPMLRRVKAIAHGHSARAYLSLEEHMACGVGACLGCVCRSNGHPAGEVRYLKVCTHGPVFEASEVEIG